MENPAPKPLFGKIPEERSTSARMHWSVEVHKRVLRFNQLTTFRGVFRK